MCCTRVVMFTLLAFATRRRRIGRQSRRRRITVMLVPMLARFFLGLLGRCRFLVLLFLYLF